MRTGKSIAGSNTQGSCSRFRLHCLKLDHFFIVLLLILTRFSSMRETAGAQITVDLGAVDKVLEMHASKIMLVFHQVRTSCCLLWFCQIAPLPHTLRHATLGVVVMKCLIRKKYNLNHPSSLVSIFLCCCACASFFPPTLDSLFLSYKSIYKRICRGGHLQVQKNIKLGWLNFKKDLPVQRSWEWVRNANCIITRLRLVHYFFTHWGCAVLRLLF